MSIVFFCFTTRNVSTCKSEFVQSRQKVSSWGQEILLRTKWHNALESGLNNSTSLPRPTRSLDNGINVCFGAASAERFHCKAQDCEIQPRTKEAQSYTAAFIRQTSTTKSRTILVMSAGRAGNRKAETKSYLLGKTPSANFCLLNREKGQTTFFLLWPRVHS